MPFHPAGSRISSNIFIPAQVLRGDGAQRHKVGSQDLKRFPAEVNRGIPKGQVGSEAMRIDSPLGGEPCAARIPVKCEYESLDLLKREHRGGKPPSSWRSAQVPQLDGCSTGKLSAFLGQNHAEEAFLRWSDMRSGYSLLSLSSRI
jgi:hypothetical protein